MQIELDNKKTEERIVSLVLKDIDIATDAFKRIPLDAFTSKGGKARGMFNLARECHKKYETTLSRVQCEEILDAFVKDGKVNMDEATGFKLYYDSLLYTENEKQAYDTLKDILLNSHYKKAKLDIHIKILEAYKANDFKKAKQLELKAEQLTFDEPQYFNGAKSGNELKALDIKPPQFIIDELIPEGLTVFSAERKAGKSIMAMQMIKSVAEGSTFLGNSVAQGQAVYFAMEHSDQLNKERSAKIECFSDNAIFFSSASKIPKLDTSGIVHLKQYLNTLPNLKLAVIDTWQLVAPEGSKFKNAYENDYDSISKIKKLADELHIAIVLITHKRKAKGNNEDSFSQVMGSGGVTGVADQIMMLSRKNHSDKAVLEITSRLAKEQKLSIKVDMDKFLWSLNGNGDCVETSRNEIFNEVIHIMRAEKQDEYTSSDVLTFMEERGNSIKQANLNTYLSRMANKNLLEKVSRGVYKLPLHLNYDENLREVI
ncbi:AAA family ATPase [Kiritimatiellaeota bacterium B1221]|nr:AAA family ATPase [Kiritimatiellaeota bacterium B1221]